MPIDMDLGAVLAAVRSELETLEDVVGEITDYDGEDGMILGRWDAGRFVEAVLSSGGSVRINVSILAARLNDLLGLHAHDASSYLCSQIVAMTEWMSRAVTATHYGLEEDQCN